MKHLDEIVARAEPLWERLRRPPPQVSDPSLGAARLGRWQQRAAGNDPHRFERRLEWSGWRREDVLRVLGSAGELTGFLPVWAATLDTMGRSATGADSSGESARSDLPFEPLFLPIASVAEERIAAAAGWSLLSPDARLSLRRSLLARLAEIAAPALYAEFVKSLPNGPDLVSVLIGPPRTRSTVHFDACVRRHLADGFDGLFLSYPVLGRLLATAVDDWSDAVSEFLARFASDREALGVEAIAGLRPGLSEPHNHGRSVFALETDTGRRLVYKARSLDGEAAFARMAEWCNRQAPAGWLPLLAAAATRRDGYGWMEFVEAAACRDQGEAERCFERIGELLGLLHVLQSSDVNRENLIIQGEHPVLIDAETLLQPDARPLEPPAHGTERWAEVVRQFGRSVVRTGLLPVWEVHPAGDTAFDLGGLGGAEPERSPVKGPRFHNVNTDSMVLVNDFGEMPPNANIVRVDGRSLPAADFAEQIVAGFGRAHELIAEKREEFREALVGVGSDGPLRLRYVYRPTRVYGAILVAARTPERLTDGIDFSLELDQVSRAFLGASARPGAFGMLEAELEALERGEVPYFTMESTSGAAESGDRRIDRIFEGSALSRVEGKLAELDDPGAARQMIIIRGVLDASCAHLSAPAEDMLPDPEELAPATEVELLGAAAAIADGIRRCAVRTRSDQPGPHACWMGIVPLPRSNRYGFGVLGDDLYQGSSGIALFLAALARVTGSSEDADLINEALWFARDGWKELTPTSRETWARSMGEGAASGLLSLVYALLRSGTLLGRTDLVAAAVDLAGVLDADVLFDDPVCDVIAGQAGAVLVLLRLFDETGEPGLRRAAIRRGESLLEHRSGTDGGARAWLFYGKRLAGFGHGAAGIAWALLRLFEATSDERFLEAAREGMAYEDSLFDPVVGNWRDVRDLNRVDGHSPFMTAWCHGAAGIGMARLAGLSICQDRARRADVDRALAATAAHSLDDVDHLCCGNFGRLDLLWTAARKLGRPDLAELALRKANWLLKRSEATGGFRLAQRPVAVSSAPSLFRGAAGVGYELLRLIPASGVPSVLLFE